MGWSVGCDCYTYFPCFSFAFFNAHPFGNWDWNEDEECECDRYADADEIVERNWTWKWNCDPNGNPIGNAYHNCESQ
jgi:hypothetical protein